MPTVTFDHETLRNLQGRAGLKHDPSLWEERLSDIGCVVEKCDEEEVEIEVFPDRPDLLSIETMAYAARSFLHGSTSEPALPVQDGKVEMSVDSSLESIRPVILGAIDRGVDGGSEPEERERFIQSLMDHQEKLHLTLGRRRRLASIGVHDLKPLSPPFRVITVPGSHRFKPLATDHEMSIDEILQRHPKGIEYAHLMEGFDRHPVIVDRYDRVLSYPPIINGDHTTVLHETTDFFIDVTGWDRSACEACLLLVCLSLSMRGGIIESIDLTEHDGQRIRSPDGSPRRHRLPERLLTRILGRRIEESEIASAIDRMGGRLVETRTATEGPLEASRWADTAVGERMHVIDLPRWRADVMHPVDLVEEIATGIGYEELGESLSNLAIEGVPLPHASIRRRLRASLGALGIQEVQSLTLSSEDSQFDRTRWKNRGNPTRIANPITNEHTILRQRILPSLLELLAANRHHELPQRVYEIGEVVADHSNARRIGWACAESSAGFTAAKGFVNAILRDLGGSSISDSIEHQAIEDGEGPWLVGRGARASIDGTVVGEYGEIDPEVGHSFGLRVPIHAGEFDVDALSAAIPDPVL